MTGSAPVLVYLLGYNYEIDDLTILRKWNYSGGPKTPSNTNYLESNHGPTI